MEDLSQKRKKEVAQFIVEKLECTQVDSCGKLKYHLGKLRNIYTPFFPKRWAERPSDILTEEQVSKMESGMRIIETLINESPVIGPTKLRVAISRDARNNYGKSYGVYFFLYGSHSTTGSSLMPIAYGLLSDVSEQIF